MRLEEISLTTDIVSARLQNLHYNNYLYLYLDILLVLGET